MKKSSNTESELKKACKLNPPIVKKKSDTVIIHTGTNQQSNRSNE